MRGRVEFLWSRVTHILDGGGILAGEACRARASRAAFDGLDSARIRGRDRWQSPTTRAVLSGISDRVCELCGIYQGSI